MQRTAVLHVRVKQCKRLLIHLGGLYIFWCRVLTPFPLKVATYQIDNITHDIGINVTGEVMLCQERRLSLVSVQFKIPSHWLAVIRYPLTKLVMWNSYPCDGKFIPHITSIKHYCILAPVSKINEFIDMLKHVDRTMSLTNVTKRFHFWWNYLFEYACTFWKA